MAVVALVLSGISVSQWLAWAAIVTSSSVSPLPMEDAQTPPFVCKRS